jgi:hypothetical protein
MSELPMRGHFRYLRFKTFPMTPRTPQCKVFCPLLSSSEHSGVPKDSQPPTFPSVGLHPHTWPKWGCDNHSHSRKWDLGVLWDYQKLRAQLQGSKHLALRRSLYRWKGLEVQMSKWPRMSHLDICSTSYGRKKGRKSNWQFDSRALKVGNRPDSGACRWSATHCWKALKEATTLV